MSDDSLIAICWVWRVLSIENHKATKATIDETIADIIETRATIALSTLTDI